MIENYEEFDENQIKTLKNYVTNTTSNIFVLRNLPEVIKGALFSRYSRSSLGLRSLLLKEFILNEETAFASIAAQNKRNQDQDQAVAIQKAQNFYDRILDGYGDDSIGELGGAHLAIENISMIAAKIIEDARIGGSPLEKSTRYIYFDQKIKGEYQFYREPNLMTSAYRDLYINTCNNLFDVYAKLAPILTEMIEKKFPREKEVSSAAYAAALRAKVLDCLRGLLPASTLTNMGVFGNGRFFESLIQKLNSTNLSEMQETGRKMHHELAKVIPSFVRRAEASHKYQIAFSAFKEQMESELSSLSSDYTKQIERFKSPGVRLVDYDSDAPIKVASSLLFAHCDKGLAEIKDYCAKLPKETMMSIIDAASNARENRRMKSPRALEHATFTFEIIADFGVYRDLQRHRMLTQERQFLSCDYGFYIPDEVLGTELEDPYKDAMEKAKLVYDLISKELPEEAQYVVPMAYNIRWYFHVNLRALQWLCELRSAPAGHITYRYIAQEMAKQVIDVFPEFERVFKFVDYDGYELGRLGQEIRKAEKLKTHTH